MIELDFKALEQNGDHRRDGILREAVEASRKATGHIDEFFIIDYLIGRIVPTSARLDAHKLRAAADSRIPLGIDFDSGVKN